MTVVFIKRKILNTDTLPEITSCEVKADIKMVCLKAKECQRLPATSREGRMEQFLHCLHESTLPTPGCQVSGFQTFEQYISVVLTIQ